jgi:hypothetical protein
MCPACMATVVLTAASATSGAGLLTLMVVKWRTLRRGLAR